MVEDPTCRIYFFLSKKSIHGPDDLELIIAIVQVPASFCCCQKKYFKSQKVIENCVKKEKR